jgi:hypothetical protein
VSACPGPRRCYALGGNEPCREHGCRVCGSIILADCEDWPAPLCLVHAPEALIDTATALRRELDRMLGLFDGAHQVDCNLFKALGRSSSDLELSLHIERGGRSLCTCGFYAIRQEVRERFGLSGSGETRRDATGKELLS